MADGDIPAPAPAPEAPATPAVASEDRRAKRIARNKRWREAHKEEIRIRRAARRAALAADPEKLAAKRERDRLARRKRMEHEETRKRVRDLRKAWRARKRAAKLAVVPASESGVDVPAVVQ